MRLSDLSDSRRDELEIFFTEDAGSKKKKKGKKDKDKDRDKKGKKKDKNMPKGREAYKESLKELGKNKLHDKLIELGIDTRKVDLESKKEMRRAIMKKVYGEKSAFRPDDSEGSSERIKPSKHRFDRPPYYFDEDLGDFVVTGATDRTDLECFDAMRSLGALRRSVRADDGFGELMDRLTSKVTEAANKGIDTPSDIIDVTDFSVSDPKPSRQEKEMRKIVGEMSDDKLKMLDEALDKAVEKSKHRKKS